MVSAKRIPELAGTSWGACSTTWGTGVMQARAEELDPFQRLGRCFHPSSTGEQEKVWDTAGTRSFGLCSQSGR